MQLVKSKRCLWGNVESVWLVKI